MGNVPRQTGLVLKISKANVIALVFLVVALTVSFYQASAFAQEVPYTIPTNQTSSVVEGPRNVAGTSANSNRSIVWTWAAPAGGLTPDASSSEVTNPNAQPTAPATQQPSDIVLFGYELFKTGNPVTSGTVGSSALTITTPVTENGDYTLYARSITRAGDVSAKTSGSITISATNTLAPQPDAEAPAISTAETTPPPSVPQQSPRKTTPSTAVKFSKTPGYIANIPGADVLATTNANDAPAGRGTEPLDIIAVMKTVPWYAWATIVAVAYVIMRVLLRVTVNL